MRFVMKNSLSASFLLATILTFLSFIIKAQNVTRGPYLNQATPNSVIIKWRTNVATTSQVWFGTSLSSLSSFSFNANSTTNHEIKISGLQPATKYYYMVGNTTTTLTPKSSQQYFLTSPVTGSAGKYKFWVIGDAGTGSANQINAKNAFLNYTDSSHIDGWIWLGDNAYDGGFDSEYQNNVFAQNIYANELKRVVVWPALGNHDYNHFIPFSPPPAYFDIFSLPTNGEAGGVASGTEKYYSYNYGNIHFIVLDSYGTGRGANDPMAQWLQNDLNTNTLPWVIAYWHHPPYTKGSHNSDNSNFLDGELVDMRINILPILENGGVDLILNGHSHCYERSKLIDSHYGYSNQLNPSMVLDGGSGNYPVTCPYRKNTLVSKAHKGTVYAVVGCSGKTSGTSSGWPHPVMHSYTNSQFGSMLIEIEKNKLTAKFINSNSQVFDSFTIVKNAGKKTTKTICQGESVFLKPSVPGTVNWQPLNIASDSISVSPPFSTVYYAVDLANCVKDTFEVNVIPNNVPPCNVPSFIQEELSDNEDVIIAPTRLNSMQQSEIFLFSKKHISRVCLLDMFGRQMSINIYDKHEPNGKYVLVIGPLPPGIYSLRFQVDIEVKNTKLLIK